MVMLFQTAIFTTASFHRPSWDKILNPFSKLESNICPDGFDDGGCETCNSCFYLEAHTSDTGKTFSEGQVGFVYLMDVPINKSNFLV